MEDLGTKFTNIMRNEFGPTSVDLPDYVVFHTLQWLNALLGLIFEEWKESGRPRKYKPDLGTLSDVLRKLNLSLGGTKITSCGALAKMYSGLPPISKQFEKTVNELHFVMGFPKETILSKSLVKCLRTIVFALLHVVLNYIHTGGMSNTQESFYIALDNLANNGWGPITDNESRELATVLHQTEIRKRWKTPYKCSRVRTKSACVSLSGKCKWMRNRRCMLREDARCDVLKTKRDCDKSAECSWSEKKCHPRLREGERKLDEDLSQSEEEAIPHLMHPQLDRDSSQLEEEAIPPHLRHPQLDEESSESEEEAIPPHLRHPQLDEDSSESEEAIHPHIGHLRRPSLRNIEWDENKHKRLQTLLDTRKTNTESDEDKSIQRLVDRQLRTVRDASRRQRPGENVRYMGKEGDTSILIVNAW
jgi:hypothetical protein